MLVDCLYSPHQTQAMLNVKAQQSLLATNFRTALEESRVSPKTIAEACDITEQAVSNWKRTGKIANKHLATIARLTDWSVSRLLTGHEPATSAPATKVENSVFETLTADELELLNNFRAMMDADQEVLRKEIADRAERIRAHMRKYSEHHGLPDLVAKEAAARRPKMAAAIAVKVTERLRQRSLLDDHPGAGK